MFTSAAAGAAALLLINSSALLGSIGPEYDLQDLPESVRPGERLTVEVPAGSSLKYVGEGENMVSITSGRSVRVLDTPWAISDASGSLMELKWVITGDDLFLDASEADSDLGSLDLNLTLSEMSATVGVVPREGDQAYVGDYTELSPEEMSATAARRFIGIPSRYVYDPDLGSLHDYCTWSPDRFGSADFRGPCANHDLCYMDGFSHSYCNDVFWYYLQVNCRYAYADVSSAALQDCYNQARLYYWGVNIVNP